MGGGLRFCFACSAGFSSVCGFFFFTQNKGALSEIRHWLGVSLGVCFGETGERCVTSPGYRCVSMDQLAILRYMMKKKADKADRYFVTYPNQQFFQVCP